MIAVRWLLARMLQLRNEDNEIDIIEVILYGGMGAIKQYVIIFLISSSIYKPRFANTLR